VLVYIYDYQYAVTESVFQPGMFPGGGGNSPGNRQLPRKFSADRIFLNGSFNK